MKRACREYQTDDKVIKYRDKLFFLPPTTAESGGAIYGLLGFHGNVVCTVKKKKKKPFSVRSAPQLCIHYSNPALV